MITIVDMGMGNIGSVSRALQFLRVAYQVSAEPAAIRSAGKLILPGVGNFAEASKRLRASGIGSAIVDNVTGNRTPILGICLGMQLLGTSGDEGAAGGNGACSPGLDLVKGHVAAIRRDDPSMRIPHMGWNDVHGGSMAMFENIADGSCFYFVHSYAMQLKEAIDHATTDYGGDLVAAIARGHVWGTQFHPEKSQDAGLQILRTFAALSC